MTLVERLRAGWTSALIGSTVLCIAVGTLAAQTSVQSGAVTPTTVEQQPELVAANASLMELPDAPHPAVSVGSTFDRNAALSTQSSLMPQSSQPPEGGISLGDLGLTPADTEGNAKRQAILDRRTHMLKIHQKLGLITVIPVAAACISSAGAPPEKGNYSDSTARDIHVALGATAAAMYAITASYAIRAPKVSNEPARGGVKWHKYLIYIHAPGMVLTPILGAMAYDQISSGQKVHGIASAHGPVAVATAASYGAAILAVSWPIHLKY